MDPVVYSDHGTHEAGFKYGGMKMNKKILIVTAALIAIVFLMSFTADKDVSAGEERTEETGICDRFAGTWYISGDTDPLELEKSFPDVYAFGCEMEIRPDGKLNWHVGAAGAAGTYEIKDDMIIATVSGIMESDECTVVIRIVDDNTLRMTYGSVLLEWTYGT